MLDVDEAADLGADFPLAKSSQVEKALHAARVRAAPLSA
jgi:hypothetical protein